MGGTSLNPGFVQKRGTSPFSFFRIPQLYDERFLVHRRQKPQACAMLGKTSSSKRPGITGSKISHANDEPNQNQGEIEWLQFSVEIVLPRGAPNGR
jgi:hypothetical protein